MQSTWTGSLKGHFLMAMPDLMDPNFSKTVTCLAESSPEGALGFVINRLHPSLTGKVIFEELKLEALPAAHAVPVHIGGPVHAGEVFILHGPPFGWESCLPITPGLALSNTMDIMEAISRGAGPESFLITLGCAGWGPGQLEAEITHNAWLTAPIGEDLVFELPIEQRWDESLRRMGIDPRQLTSTVGHA